MATEQQIPKLVASFVEHQGKFEKLTTDEAQWVIMNTQDAIALFVEAVKDRSVQKNFPDLRPLLVLLGSTTVPIPAGRFIAREWFKENTSDESAPKFGHIGEEFCELFLGKQEKVKSNKSTLRIHALRRKSKEGPIIDELGGEDKSETTLAEVFALIKKQGKCEKGKLLNTGGKNIFFVRDVNNQLQSICVFSLGTSTSWAVIHLSNSKNSQDWSVGDFVFSH